MIGVTLFGLLFTPLFFTLLTRKSSHAAVEALPQTAGAQA
jgi:hypothetical protein